MEAYAKERGWLISGIYIDAAKTARKTCTSGLKSKK